jgi:hypothetical protein
MTRAWPTVPVELLLPLEREQSVTRATTCLQGDARGDPVARRVARTERRAVRPALLQTIPSSLNASPPDRRLAEICYQFTLSLA